MTDTQLTESAPARLLAETKLAREAYTELDIVACIVDMPLGLEHWRRNVPHFKLINVLKYDNIFKEHTIM